MMKALIALICLASAASAAPAPSAPAASAPASAAPASASAKPASASASAQKPAAAPTPAVGSALGVSTYTISSLYTGDKVRDPFLPSAMGGGGAARERDKSVPYVVDIHSIQLRGIMKDAAADFAIFKADDGSSLVLRAGRLYDSSNKKIPGITGRINIKQKRAELITEDKDVQIYSLGEVVEDKAVKP